MERYEDMYSYMKSVALLSKTLNDEERLLLDLSVRLSASKRTELRVLEGVKVKARNQLKEHLVINYIGKIKGEQKNRYLDYIDLLDKWLIPHANNLQSK